jgi:hypothetical protein
MRRDPPEERDTHPPGLGHGFAEPTGDRLARGKRRLDGREDFIGLRRSHVRDQILNANSLENPFELLAVGDPDGRDVLRQRGNARVHPRPNEEIAHPNDVLDLALVVGPSRHEQPSGIPNREPPVHVEARGQIVIDVAFVYVRGITCGTSTDPNTFLLQQPYHDGGPPALCTRPAIPNSLPPR